MIKFGQQFKRVAGNADSLQQEALRREQTYMQAPALALFVGSDYSAKPRPGEIAFQVALTAVAIDMGDVPLIVKTVDGLTEKVILAFVFE